MTEKDRIIHTLRTMSKEHWRVIAGTDDRFLTDRLTWKAAAFLAAEMTEEQAAAVTGPLDYQELLEDAVVWYKHTYRKPYRTPYNTTR